MAEEGSNPKWIKSKVDQIQSGSNPKWNPLKANPPFWPAFSITVNPPITVKGT